MWLLSQAGAQNGLQYREMRPPGWKVWESCESGNSYAIFFYKLIDELNSAGTPSQKIENMGVALNLNEFQLINMRIYTHSSYRNHPVGRSIPRVECIVVDSFLYPSGTPRRQC